MRQENPETNASNYGPRSSAARPDFVDTLIIIFVSAAAIIFIFWIASQTLNLENFVKVPDFIRDSFKAVWTSIATGATGIGLAVYKALTRSREKPLPNYLLLIGVTTGSILLLILLLILVMRSLGPHVRISPPPDTELLEVGAQAPVSHALDLRPAPGGLIYYEMKGRYTVEGRTIQGRVEQASLSISRDLRLAFPMHFQTVSISVCYVRNEQGNEILFWYPDPMFPQWGSAARIDIDAAPGLNQALPAMNFKIDLPEGIGQGKMWLCSALAHDGGGYFPGYQISSSEH